MKKYETRGVIMDNFKFTYEEKNFELKEENCEYINNEELENFHIATVLDILCKSENVDFEREYYDSCCDQCRGNRKDDTKFFQFLEYHFYIFTKDGKYVLSSISKEYETTTYTALMKEKKIDNSYIVSVLVCNNCETWAVEIEQCEM